MLVIPLRVEESSLLDVQTNKKEMAALAIHLLKPYRIRYSTNLNWDIICLHEGRLPRLMFGSSLSLRRLGFYRNFYNYNCFIVIDLIYEKGNIQKFILKDVIFNHNFDGIVCIKSVLPARLTSEMLEKQKDNCDVEDIEYVYSVRPEILTVEFIMGQCNVFDAFIKFPNIIDKSCLSRLGSDMLLGLLHNLLAVDYTNPMHIKVIMTILSVNGYEIYNIPLGWRSIEMYKTAFDSEPRIFISLPLGLQTETRLLTAIRYGAHLLYEKLGREIHSSLLTPNVHRAINSYLVTGNKRVFLHLDEIHKDLIKRFNSWQKLP